MKLFKRRSVASEGPEPESDYVEADRGPPSVARVLSFQSRISNVLALGLMAALGLGLLTWYYARTFSQPARARDEAKIAARNQAQGDVVLPPLGPIDPPQPSVAEKLLGAAPEAPPPDDIPDAWLQPAQDAPAPPMTAAPAQTQKSPAEVALERKLSGPVVAQHAGANSTGSATPDETVPVEGSMATLLKPSFTPAVAARILPTQRLLLPKGAFIDCTLETAIDSTLPGMVTCITATDTFGADGAIVLMERGSKLIGETRGQVQQGSARIFVLWTEVRTPMGVVIPLASPGTDELGRSGLPGQVNRHFWDRFGAAILISVVDGAIQREVQPRSSGNGGAVIYDPSASQDVMTEVLKSTINIPPTVTKHNGDRIQILVARDLDFRSVYELRPTTRAR